MYCVCCIRRGWLGELTRGPSLDLFFNFRSFIFRVNAKPDQTQEGNAKNGNDEHIVLPEVAEPCEILNLRAEHHLDTGQPRVDREGLHTNLHRRHRTQENEPRIHQERIHQSSVQFHRVQLPAQQTHPEFEVAFDTAPQQIVGVDREANHAQHWEPGANCFFHDNEEIIQKRVYGFLWQDEQPDVNNPRQRQDKRAAAEEELKICPQNNGTSPLAFQFLGQLELFVLLSQQVIILFERAVIFFMHFFLPFTWGVRFEIILQSVSCFN